MDFTGSISDTCPPELRPLLERNRIPEAVGRIHLIAVCGTAMGALAAMLRELGYEVTGSDENVYPPMSTFLEKRQIPVRSGFSEENLSHPPDLVVVGNTVSKGNPEVEAVHRRKLFFCSMPQAINHFVAAGKKRIVVTGTHGKTTTSALIAWILEASGRSPSFVIGGILENFAGNYQLGNGPHIVLEGDEYDTAYFDKGPKFLHYPPHAAVLTGVEFDHADIYRDLAHVKAAFSRFVSAIPADAHLLAASESETVSAVLAGGRCPIHRYGIAAGDWTIGKVTVAPPWTEFEVRQSGKRHGVFKTKLMGEHNLANILAAVGVAERMGIPAGQVASALETFAGIRRRQQIRGVANGVTVMDDFAHHPTAVRETIRAVRPFFPAGRLIAVFEPRTNSSMRRIFQEVYPAAFDGADLICIRKPPLLSKIPEAERFSSEQLVADLKGHGKDARFFAETEPIVDFVAAEARKGDLVLVMSNGGFDNVHQRLLEALGSGESAEDRSRPSGYRRQ
jgi:UDP-N-acetylmuramate: L-alanyl-gamma-D-glutamyl-meso-diaminopimelate ligase